MNTIFEGKHLLVIESEDWEFAERKKGKSAVAILAVTDGKLILIEQLRRPLNRMVIDLPAGLVGDGGEHEDPAQTAIRELEEETGYTCDSVELLAGGPTSPGITSEVVRLFWASGVHRVGDGGGVDGEDIKVHFVPVDEVESWLRRQDSVDMKVWAALYFLGTRTP